MQSLSVPWLITSRAPLDQSNCGTFIAHYFACQGHDTTASGLTWLFYLVGAHPHVQHKARQEVDRFFGEIFHELFKYD